MSSDSEGRESFLEQLLLEEALGKSILAGQGMRQGSSFPRRARTEALVPEWQGPPCAGMVTEGVRVGGDP